MYILDTDVVTLFFHHRDQQPLLVSRILATPSDCLWISVITAEEMIQGAFKLIRRDQQTGKGTGGYAVLTKILQDIPSFQILPFDDQADLIYKTMPAAIRRLGSTDDAASRPQSQDPQARDALTLLNHSRCETISAEFLFRANRALPSDSY